MNEKRFLHIVPEKIIFRDLNIGESESFEIWAKNISKKPMKIRFSLPPILPFTVDQIKTNVTPPGLEVKTLIHYKNTKHLIEKDFLLVECDDAKYSILSEQTKISTFTMVYFIKKLNLLRICFWKSLYN